MRRQYEVTFDYYAGVMTTSFSGWVVGTLLGALAGHILPDSLLSAFGIALYGMFIAIVIPPCRTSKAVVTVVLTAMVFPAVLYSTASIYSALIGMIVAIILSFFKRGLLTVALSTTATVFVVELIMRLV